MINRICIFKALSKLLVTENWTKTKKMEKSRSLKDINLSTQFFFSTFPSNILNEHQKGKRHRLLDISSDFAETEIFIMTMRAIIFLLYFVLNKYS
jgi:hypothetical protein